MYFKFPLQWIIAILVSNYKIVPGDPESRPFSLRFVLIDGLLSWQSHKAILMLLMLFVYSTSVDKARRRPFIPYRFRVPSLPFSCDWRHFLNVLAMKGLDATGNACGIAKSACDYWSLWDGILSFSRKPRLYPSSDGAWPPYSTHCLRVQVHRQNGKKRDSKKWPKERWCISYFSPNLAKKANQSRYTIPTQVNISITP